jgi:hypothetical protein
MSIFECVVMDRSEKRAAYVAGASALSWIVMIVVTLLHRPRVNANERPTGMFHKAMRFTTVAANQSLVHVSLFFCAPFYAQVFSWTPLETIFAAIYVAAILISLWDPLCEHVLLHAVAGPMYLAFASFVGWNAVLPMLGVPHRVGVWVAAGTVSVIMPLVQLFAGVSRQRLLGTVGAAVAVPLILLAGGVRALPPAPLRMVSGGIGTGVVDRELVGATKHFDKAPAALVCFTAIRAPFGLKDALIHQWRHEGKVTHEVSLDVRGGRKQGFRTWSRLALSRHAKGAYRCDVVTTLGQVVGSNRVTIGN